MPSVGAARMAQKAQMDGVDFDVLKNYFGENLVIQCKKE